VVGVVLSSGALAGCGSEGATPGVVGVALDDAHDQLQEAGFEEFEDEDLFEDRAIFMDSNWVVLEQEPAAGQMADRGAPVTLRVGKIEEGRALERLPEDSPVLASAQQAAAEEKAEAAQRADDEAAEAAEEAAAQVRLLSDYVNALDPFVRLSNGVFEELDRTAAGVRDDESRLGQSAAVSAGLDAVDTMTDQLQDREPPKGSERAAAHEAMLEATERLRQGTATLLSATGAQKAASLDRWEEVRLDARGQWNAAVAAMYEGSGVTPPLLS